MGGPWRGQTAVCIASGPSLTAEDCETVRGAGVKVIAVNNSWQLAPFCDVLYAGDYKWWAKYRGEVTIGAARWTCNIRAATEFGVTRHAAAGPYNSGMRAIQLAAWLGARCVILLGYDCGAHGERKHWHPDHQGLSNPNVARMQAWTHQFTRLSLQLKRVDIVNCSRRTALRCFRRLDLNTALMETAKHGHQRGETGPAPDHPVQGDRAEAERGVQRAA